MSEESKRKKSGKAFLGRGWKYPVTFRESHKTVMLSQYEQDIRESLNILLSTERGERVMRPEYGTNIRDLLFEPLDVSTATLVGEEIKKAILLNEPRVFVESVILSESFSFVTIVSIGTISMWLYGLFFLIKAQSKVLEMIEDVFDKTGYNIK